MMNKLLLLLFLLPIMMWGQMQNPRNIPFNWKTDTTQTIIDLSEITVVLPRGSFQVLNYPKFIGREEGLKSFFEKEPVMFLEVHGVSKAYPLNMLSVHEIANDTLAGIPILATFCPLCNS
ncbi:MAG TPA: DUF3179 domain-containing protein, partial [Ignavibacteria bacterium]|nr:DUF3179 domain-containing protein [Ignavibacteria bacterium]